jgi:hypothetical protein
MTAPGDSTDVGSIVAYLRLNRSDWDRELREAQAAAERLGRTNPDIRIQVNSGAIVAQLAAVAAAVHRLEESNTRLAGSNNDAAAAAAHAAAAASRAAQANNNLGSSAQRAQGGVRGLIGVLLALAPAAVPIGAVAGGALLGLLPVAATVALGIKGIGEQFKSGEIAAGQYGASIATVQTEAQRLKNIASAGLLSGIDRAIQGSRPLFREINTDVSMLSGQLGDIVASAAPALLSILTQLNPLFVTFGNLIATGAQKLSTWAQSTTGISSFVQYVQAELPAVMNFLGQLIVLFSHIVQAAAPFGGVVLSGLTVLVTALNSIPIGTLQQLVPLLVAGYVALRAYRAVVAIINSVSAALVLLRTRAITVASATGLVGAAVAAIGVLAFALSDNDDQATAAADAMQSYADAVEKTTSATSKAAVAQTIDNLTKGKAFSYLDLLHKNNVALGVSYDDLTNAVNGSDAQFKQTTDTLGKFGYAGKQINEILTANRTGLNQAVTAQKQHNKAANEAARAAAAQNAALDSQAAKYGTTRDAYLAAGQAAKKNAEQTREQTVAMQLAGDAAGLLQQALDGLAGINLSVATARTSLASANLSVTKSFKDNGAAINGNTAKAVANQQAIQGNVQAARQLAETIGKQTHSTVASKKSLEQSRDALIDQLRAQGQLTPAVQAYINKLYSLDRIKLKPTKLDVQVQEAQDKIADLRATIRAIKQGKVPGLDADTKPGKAAIAALRSDINALRQDRRASVDIDTSIALAKLAALRTAMNSLPSVSGSAGTGQKRPYATGGAIRGAGTGTSDSIIIAASNGEFMATAKSYTRNAHALEAGNRGAKLSIAGYAEGGLVTNRRQIYRVDGGYGFQGQYFGGKNAYKDAQQALADFVHNLHAAARYVGDDNKALAEAKAAFASSNTQKILKRAGQYYYGGQGYATRDLAREAKREAVITRGREDVTVTRGKGGVTAVTDLLRSQIPGAKRAMRDLAKAADEAFQLKKTEAALDKVRDKLTEMKGYRGQVESVFAGKFDPTQFGSIAGLIGGLGGAAKGNNDTAAQVKKLTGEGLNKNYLNDLVAKGDTSTLSVLAAGDKGDISSVNKALGGYNSSLTAIGNQAVATKYDKSIAQQSKDVSDLVASAKTQQADIKELAQAVSQFTHKPTIVQIDGKTIASVAYTHITNRLHHGVRHHSGGR